MEHGRASTACQRATHARTVAAEASALQSAAAPAPLPPFSRFEGARGMRVRSTGRRCVAPHWNEGDAAP